MVKTRRPIAFPSKLEARSPISPPESEPSPRSTTSPIPIVSLPAQPPFSPVNFRLSVAAVSFHPFPRLSEPIRRKIWDFARPLDYIILEAQATFIFPQEPLEEFMRARWNIAAACKEARGVILGLEDDFDGVRDTENDDGDNRRTPDENDDTTQHFTFSYSFSNGGRKQPHIPDEVKPFIQEELEGRNLSDLVLGGWIPPSKRLKRRRRRGCNPGKFGV